ncbi:hypothetical protein quinque_014031 [Culex quinquefasciatus]
MAKSLSRGFKSGRKRVSVWANIPCTGGHFVISSSDDNLKIPSEPRSESYDLLANYKIPSQMWLCGTGDNPAWNWEFRFLILGIKEKPSQLVQIG